MKIDRERLLSIVFGEVELSVRSKKGMSIIFIFIALALAWIPKDIKVFWIIPWEVDGFLPNLLTGIIGMVIVLPLYIRNIFKWKTTSVFTILAFLLNVTLCATFVKIILGGGELEFTLITTSLIAAVIITWLGMRPIVPLAWASVFGLGAIALVKTSYIMGLSGFLFIVFGFLGILLHSELDIASLTKEVSEQFKGPSKALKDAAGDILKN